MEVFRPVDSQLPPAAANIRETERPKNPRSEKNGLAFANAYIASFLETLSGLSYGGRKKIQIHNRQKYRFLCIFDF